MKPRSIAAWNNELHLTLTVRGENRDCKRLHVRASLMLAHERVAKKAPEVGKSNRVVQCCDSEAAGFRCAGLILCFDCAFNQKKLPNWTSCLDQKAGRGCQGRYVSFRVVSELSLFARWLGVNYSGLLRVCSVRMNLPPPPSPASWHHDRVGHRHFCVREFSAEAWC